MAVHRDAKRPKKRIVPSMTMQDLAALLGFCFRHCFFLENTVRRRCRIAEEMREKVKSG